jgi:hypothetical protein
MAAAGRRRVTFAPLPPRRRRLGLYPIALPWLVLGFAAVLRTLIRA